MVATGTSRISATVVVVAPVVNSRSAGVEIDDLVSMFETTNEDRLGMAEARQWVGSNSQDRSSLKFLRMTAGLSQAALANAINMSQPNVSSFEAGLRVPSRATVKKLARALRVTAEDIYSAIEGQFESEHV